MSYVSHSLKDERAFTTIRMLYRANAGARNDSNISQHWFPEISDQTLQYALYRGYLQAAVIHGEMIGFALLFSSLVEIFEKDSANAFQSARLYLSQRRGFDPMRCLYFYNVIDEEHQEAFHVLVHNLISCAMTERYYVSHIIVLQHENIVLHHELIKQKFQLVGSIPFRKGRLPINIFAYGIA